MAVYIVCSEPLISESRQPLQRSLPKAFFIVAYNDWLSLTFQKFIPYYRWTLTSVAKMKGTRERPSLIKAETLPTVNSDLVVFAIAKDKLPETLSRPANMGCFFQQFRLLASWADGVSVYDDASGHLRFGIVVIAIIANDRTSDVDFPNIHLVHAPF